MAFIFILGPKQGSIIHQQLKVAIQAFSLKDLQTGQIAYQPDSRANPGPDSVLLQATDNYNVLTVLLEIDIRAKVLDYIYCLVVKGTFHIIQFALCSHQTGQGLYCWLHKIDDSCKFPKFD